MSLTSEPRHFAIVTGMSTGIGVRARPRVPGERLRLCAAACGQQIDAPFANAGRGLGRGFLDQDPAAWRCVVHNTTGTPLLLQKIGRDLRAAGADAAVVERAGLVAEMHRSMPQPRP